MVGLLLVMMLPADVRGQRQQDTLPADTTSPVEAGLGHEAVPDRVWWTLWSRGADMDRVILGMWSLHLRRLHWGLDYNGAFGVVYKNLVAATFITTHDERGFSVGVDRAWGRTRWGPLEAMVGFRAGLVYGYDERLAHIGHLSPMLPYLQPLGHVSAGPVWVEVAYVWRISSIMVGVHF